MYWVEIIKLSAAWSERVTYESLLREIVLIKFLDGPAYVVLVSTVELTTTSCKWKRVLDWENNCTLA